MRHLIPLTTLTSLLVVGTAGAMTITSSPTPPAMNVLLSRDVTVDAGSYDCDRGLGASSEIGQTFRLPTAADLDRITIRVRPETDVAGVLVILYLGTFADEDDVTMDDLLVAEIRALPDPLPVGVTTYLTFHLDDQHLDANRQYGFVVGFSGGDHPGEARLDVLHVGDDTYAGGQAIEWTGLQEVSLPNDLVFYLQGTEDDNGAPPEPLVLLDGRFTVEASWATADREGPGHPVKLTEESGTFWFFSADNVELVVKVHDACVDPWNRYWVFLAGLTNVGVEIRVVDLVADFEHTYRTTAGEVFQTILDTSTFATCAAD